MKKKLIFILLCTMFLVTACSANDSNNIKVKKTQGNDLKIMRLNNISTYFQGTFENIDIKDKEISIDAVQYLNNKKIKSVPLIKTAKNEGNITSFDFDFSILNVINKDVVLNTMYNNSAVGKEVLTFKGSSESYDYGVLNEDIKLDDKNKVYLGYYGINKTNNIPEDIQNIIIQNYIELIVIELTIKK